MNKEPRACARVPLGESKKRALTRQGPMALTLYSRFIIRLMGTKAIVRHRQAGPESFSCQRWHIAICKDSAGRSHHFPVTGDAILKPSCGVDDDSASDVVDTYASFPRLWVMKK